MTTPNTETLAHHIFLLAEMCMGFDLTLDQARDLAKEVKPHYPDESNMRSAIEKWKSNFKP